MELVFVLVGFLVGAFVVFGFFFGFIFGLRYLCTDRQGLSPGQHRIFSALHHHLFLARNLGRAVPSARPGVGGVFS